MEDLIRNRVAENDQLVVFDLEDYFPPVGVREVDLTPLASEGIVREAAARKFIDHLDPDDFAYVVVAITFGAEVIVPQWIWPMASSRLAEAALYLGEGSKEAVLGQYYAQRLSRIDWTFYAGKKVLLKGCGQYPVPNSAYVQAAMYLRLSAQKLMYGEACSNVPIYRG